MLLAYLDTVGGVQARHACCCEPAQGQAPGKRFPLNSPTVSVKLASSSGCL